MEVPPEKAKRKSYRRETKLAAVKWHQENGRNIAMTSRKFRVDRKMIRNWLKAEESIRESKQYTRKLKCGRKSMFPDAEKPLFEEFKTLRAEGKAVKRWWFNKRMKQLLTEHYPDAADSFCHSDQWFARFCRRFRISLRRKTHTAQKTPDQLSESITKFHKYLLRVRHRGKYQLKDIANMDQTPLPFILDDGKTFAVTGEKDVWCVTGASGLDKRQCTVQLTVFGDGVPRVKPAVIFRGKGVRIRLEERKAWDKRVNVYFQPSAWCDEKVMKDWISNDWGNVLMNPHTPGSTGKILIADVHRAQQTEAVKTLLKKCRTELVNIYGGLTPYIQVLDVIVNGPFKDDVQKQSEEHMEKNLQLYTDNKLSASARRILITEWVGKAWKNLDRESIAHGFKKCGLTTNLDGSDNHEVNLEKLPNYDMPTDPYDDEFNLDSDSDSSDEEGNAEYVIAESTESVESAESSNESIDSE